MKLQLIIQVFDSVIHFYMIVLLILTQFSKIEKKKLLEFYENFLKLLKKVLT